MCYKNPSNRQAKFKKQPQLSLSTWKICTIPHSESYMLPAVFMFYPPAGLANTVCHRSSGPSKEQEVARLRTRQLDLQALEGKKKQVFSVVLHFSGKGGMMPEILLGL